MPIGPISQTIDGVTKHMCGSCHKFKKRQRFAKKDSMKVPICGDCYALQYGEDLFEILDLVKKAPLESMDEINKIFDELVNDTINESNDSESSESSESGSESNDRVI